MLFALNSPVETVLDECMSGIFERIKQKHPQEEINGIFNSLESFECVRSISRKWNIPLFNYSFSAVRKPHGYRQTLYHVNRDRFWTAEECESRWHKFEKELKDSHVPIFTNQEIIAIIGKERTLPLLQLMDSSPKYEMGVCCECYALLPQVFNNDPYTDDDIFYECKKIFGKDKMKVRSHSLHLDEIQVDRTEVRNDPAAFLLSCKRLAAVQSQILLKALLWKRTAVMKKDTLAFAFLCAKDVETVLQDNLEGLNYMQQELNELLNQSNIYLNNSRKENKQLKKRILNLEKSINMISRNNLSKITESKYLLTYNNNNNRDLNI
jgi:hypothetical protein